MPSSKRKQQKSDQPSPVDGAPQASVELIQFTLDHFADMAFWVRSDGRFVYANQTASSLLGYTKEELLEMHVWDLDPHFHPDRWKQHWAEICERKSFRIETVQHTKSGSIIPVEIQVNYIQHEGKEYNFAYAHDLRAKKRSERLLNALTQAGREIDRALTYDTIFEAAAQELGAIDFKVMLMLMDEGKQNLYTRYLAYDHSLLEAVERLIGIKQRDFFFPVDQVEIYRQVVQERKSIIVEDTVMVVRDALPRAVKGFARQITGMLGVESIVAVPFLMEDEVHGVISVQGKDLTEEDVPAITAFSQHLASAWRKASLYEIAQQEIEERKHIEEELIIERDRAEIYLNSAAVVLVALDLDGRITVMNKRGMQLIGCTEDELRGDSLVDRFVPEESQAQIQSYFKGIEHGEHDENDEIEIPLVSCCGKEYLIKWRVSTIHDLDGTPVGLLAAGEDITTRKRAEEALRESEERFRRMADSISDGLTVVEDNQVTYANDRLCEILGYPREEVMKMILMQFAAPEELKRVKEFTKQIDSIPERGGTFELWIRQKDGTRRYIQNRYSREVRAEGVDRFYVVTTDITDEKIVKEEQERLLAQIQYQANQVQQVINTVPEGVILIDDEMHYIQSNLLGSMYLEQLASIHPGDRLTTLGGQSILPLLKETESITWHDIAHQDRVYEATAQPLIGPTAVQGWVLILREVTRERQESEHTYQQERLASVGLLAGGIAHDFNNALMPITLYTEILLKDENINPRSRERLETILAQAKHAGSLTQQILDFSRRSILERISVDLTGLVREQVRLFKRTLPENIKIELDYDHRDHIVNVDATRIQQALMNLALNARDAMPEGGKLSLRIDDLHISDGEEAPLPSMVEGKWVTLQVSDTGSGIAEEGLKHIFEPFYTTKQPGSGSGLGLAQVYGIVMQHDGEIEVESAPGAGTTFTIYLPEVNLPIQASDVEIAQLPKGNGEVILVVEDDATVRTALLDVLRSLNYNPLSAQQGRDALDILAEHKEIALVLSDVVMPEMGGKELYQILRERGDTTPFVMMTGHPLKDELDEMLDGDLSGWMVKSEGTERLATLLAEILEAQS